MEDKPSPEQELSEREILIHVHLQTSHVPPVFDLSLNQPLEIFFQIKRGIVGDESPQALTILTTGSTFDGACAISSGSIELIDRADDTVIDLQNIDKTDWSSKAIRSITPSPNKSLITIVPRSRIILPITVLGRKFDHELPLGLPINIRDHLKAGHNYRLRLAVRDLNVQWWAWGSACELGITSTATLKTFPPRAAEKIVAAGHPHVDFSVVESFPTPPTLTIKLLPAPPPPLKPPNTIVTTGGDKQDEGKKKEGQQQAPITEPGVLVTVTNTGSQAITVKSNFQQLYVCPVDEDHPNGRIQGCARITSTNRPPSIMNFSIIDSFTSEELSPAWLSNSGPPVGHASPQNFTTLEPGVPVSNVVEFPAHLGRMMQGRRCVLSLRTFGVAWVEGAVKELFGKAEERGERGLWMVFKSNLRLPLMLECEDQLFYELPALEAGN